MQFFVIMNEKWLNKLTIEQKEFWHIKNKGRKQKSKKTNQNDRRRWNTERRPPNSKAASVLNLDKSEEFPPRLKPRDGALASFSVWVCWWSRNPTSSRRRASTSRRRAGASRAAAAAPRPAWRRAEGAAAAFETFTVFTWPIWQVNRPKITETGTRQLKAVTSLLSRSAAAPDSNPSS